MVVHAKLSLAEGSDNVYKGQKHVLGSKMWQPFG